MKISDVIVELEKFAPPALAEEWDNSGLMLGNVSAECTGVILALDLTLEVVRQACKRECNLIVTHHPFIFNPLKRIDYATAKGRAIEMLVKNDICVYSMHTNLDKCAGGINDTLADMLGCEEKEHDGVGVLIRIEQTTLAEFAKHVSEVICDKSLKIVGNPQKKIKSVFIVSGSGGSEYSTAKARADVLLTGDLKHHNYIDAVEDGFAIIEYSHYASEIIAQDVLARELENVRARVIKAKQSSPFRLLEEI